ncbi:hypothetical protein DFH08DRAFT_809300 [Mycena albidolilacea]|uniref:Uncharacterized protein n=1 Tax=Mycena albidolilacea TaxID=1033008 RepID=A0AAD7A281_9AGAR|nr:hypothetical protein DFH08DRAFT_809300 [Mycena albidolilacea]
MSLHNFEELVLGEPELCKDATLGDQGECWVWLFVELLPCKLEEDKVDQEVEDGISFLASMHYRGTKIKLLEPQLRVGLSSHSIVIAHQVDLGRPPAADHIVLGTAVLSHGMADTPRTHPLLP